VCVCVCVCDVIPVSLRKMFATLTRAVSTAQHISAVLFALHAACHSNNPPTL